MSVVRIKHTENYVCIHKGALEDPNLSFKAKGLWTYCMSKPDDWCFHVNHLSTVSKEKKKSIYSAIKELVQAGYCEVTRLREKGRCTGIEYIIHEIPVLKKSLPQSQKVDVENLHVEKEPLLSNDSLLSNDASLKPPNPQKGAAPDGAKEMLAFGDFVKLKKSAHDELCKSHGFEVISGLIDEMNDYLAANGKKPYKDYAAALRQWLRRRKQQQAQQKPIQNHATQGATLNDMQSQNWKLNQDLVSELKIEHPEVASGLNWFYKHHVLKDRNNSSFDVSGLINHRDFCRVLGKHLRLKIEEAKFPHVKI